jgi:integrase
MVLDQDQLRTLVEGFKTSALFPIVAVAAFTGARRSEILALRWTDLDVEKRVLRIERAIEQVHGQPLALKDPKTARGRRTIAIDGDLVGLLLAEREKHLRIMAGVPDGVAVNLSLVRLSDNALMFPSPPAPGEDFSFNKLRDPDYLTKAFARRARALGSPICASMTYGAPMKRCCLTLACRYTSSPHGAAMIRRCCYAPTPNALTRPTRARRQ